MKFWIVKEEEIFPYSVFAQNPMEQTNTIAMVLVSSIALTQESYIPLDVDNKEEDQRSAIK